jgi:hypothetical protein
LEPLEDVVLESLSHRERVAEGRVSVRCRKPKTLTPALSPRERENCEEKIEVEEGS